MPDTDKPQDGEQSEVGLDFIFKRAVLIELTEKGILSQGMCDECLKSLVKEQKHRTEKEKTEPDNENAE